MQHGSLTGSSRPTTGKCRLFSPRNGTQHATWLTDWLFPPNYILGNVVCSLPEMEPNVQHGSLTGSSRWSVTSSIASSASNATQMLQYGKSQTDVFVLCHISRMIPTISLPEGRIVCRHCWRPISCKRSKALGRRNGFRYPGRFVATDII